MSERALTVVELRLNRLLCEQAILRQLQELTRLTGLDLIRVEVFMVARAGPGDGDEPQRVASAVRIDLGV